MGHEFFDIQYVNTCLAFLAIAWEGGVVKTGGAPV